MTSIRRSRNFMNTDIVLEVAFEQAEFSTLEVTEAIEQGFGEFDRIVKQFTRFNKSSELAHLNRSGGQWYTVSEEMFKLVRAMLELAEDSDGAFDPTIIDFLEMYGYDAKYDFSKLDDLDLEERVRAHASARASWRQIELDTESMQIKLEPGQRLDLGGIGKGYAIDCAAARLEPFKNYIVDAGGDLRLSGNNSNAEPWKVALKHKHLDQEMIVGEISSNRLSLACSGSWSRRVQKFHHIIHPSSGKPTESLNTVYVTGPDATTADSRATAIMVNPTLAQKFLESKKISGFLTISAAGAVTSAGDLTTALFRK